MSFLNSAQAKAEDADARQTELETLRAAMQWQEIQINGLKMLVRELALENVVLREQQAIGKFMLSRDAAKRADEEGSDGEHGDRSD